MTLKSPVYLVYMWSGSNHMYKRQEYHDDAL
jgi:hypothetical protein